ncbi:MAG: hypothetical protein ABWX96_02020 [Propionibacteriaceae bacterium]
MSPAEIVAILALTAWAVYRQTTVRQLSLDHGRFKMAIIYVIVGVTVGGFDTPSGWAGWAMIATGLVLSFVVGVVRGRYTRVWVDGTGAVWSKGTALTVGLFLGLIATKFALGTVAYFLHIDDGAGFGEVLVMIAIMMAVQAELVHRRAVALAPQREADLSRQ